MTLDDLLILGVKLVAKKNKWPFKTALNYVTLLTALTSPAVVTVPNVFWLSAWERQYLCRFRKLLCEHYKDAGQPWRLDAVWYVDAYRGAAIECKHQ